MALTGFLTDGQCIPTSADVLNTLAAKFPQFVGGTVPDMISLSGATFTAPNTFNLTLSVHDLTGAPQFLFAHAITLMTCDPALPVNGGAALDVINAANISANFAWGFAAMVLFFFWGFVIYAAIVAIKKL